MDDKPNLITIDKVILSILHQSETPLTGPRISLKMRWKAFSPGRMDRRLKELRNRGLIMWNSDSFAYALTAAGTEAVKALAGNWTEHIV